MFRSQPGPVMIGYLDTAEVFRLAYPLAQVGVQYLTRTLQREGINVNASLLPSAVSINKHLRPSVYSVRRDKAGIEITMRQSLPAGGMLPHCQFSPNWGFRSSSFGSDAKMNNDPPGHQTGRLVPFIPAGIRCSLTVSFNEH